MTLDDLKRRRSRTRVVAVTLAIAGLATIFDVSANAARPGGGDYATLSDHQLIDEFTGSANRADNLAEMAGELWARRAQFDSGELLTKVRDDAVDPVARAYLIDLLASVNPEPTPEIIGLIDDAAMAEEVRVQALAAHRFSSSEATVLEKVARDSDGLVSFHALKALTSADPRAAARVAHDTLTSREPQSDLRMSAAYKATIRTGAVRDEVVRAMLVDRNLHSGTQVTPSTHAQNFLTKVTSSLP